MVKIFFSKFYYNVIDNLYVITAIFVYNIFGAKFDVNHIFYY